MTNISLNNEERQRIIDSYNAGNSIATISSVLCIKRTTVNAIIKIYLSEGRTRKLQRGGAKPNKISEVNKHIIRSWVDDNCCLTLGAIKQRCLDKLNINIRKSTIDRCLNNFSYSLKRIHLIPQQRNSDEVIEKRFEYANTYINMISSIDDKKYIFY